MFKDLLSGPQSSHFLCFTAYLEKAHIWRTFGRIVRILSAVAVLLIAISAVFAIRR